MDETLSSSQEADDKTDTLPSDRRRHDLMARALAVSRRLRNGDLSRASQNGKRKVKGKRRIRCCVPGDENALR